MVINNYVMIFEIHKDQYGYRKTNMTMVVFTLTGTFTYTLLCLRIVT